MSLYIFAQVMISVFSSVGFVLVVRESRRLQTIGAVCGCIGVPFWWVTIIHTEMWYTLPIHTLYTWAWGDKLWRLLKTKPI